MALASIYADAQKKDPNGNNFRPPVKPIKYAKTIAAKNGTISNVQQPTSAAANSVLSGK